MDDERLHELVSLDYYFARLRGRLVGLSDDELTWKPTADDRITIGWRLAHITSFLSDERNWLFLGQRPPTREGDDGAAVTADDAIARLEAAYAAWTSLIASVPADQWWEPLGPIAGPSASADRVAYVVHIMDELIHHAAEVGLLRDLYGARG
jgi:hypothetical protein